MNSLRIVLVMIEPPLPFGNAAGRWYYVLLKGLVELGHRVTAFATCGQPAELAEARRLFPPPDYDLRVYPHNANRSLWTKWQTLKQPYAYVFSGEFRRDLLEELSRGFDILHLEQLWSGWLGLKHAERAILNIHYLYAIDLAGVAASSPANFALRLLTRRAERFLLRQYPTVCTLTPRLSAHVQQLAPAANVFTVPLGLDLSLYPWPSAAASCKLAPRARPVVSLIGSFHWQPSISAGIRLLTRLWPEIKRRVPEARLHIVGRDARTALRQFLSLPDVTVEENVADIIPYFRASDVLLYAPEQGSGMKVKVLEAFALGVPVVTNREGVEGIPSVDGVHAGICDDDDGLIERTVVLLHNRRQREQQLLAARSLLECHCSPAATVAGMEQVYDRIICSRHAAGARQLAALSSS